MSASPAAALREPEAALARATAFLRAQARQPWLDRPWCDRYRTLNARVVGNWISELDRLLHVLLDAAARDAGHATTGRQRNTAAKLALVCGDAGWSTPRLHGLSRAHATFRYTGGAARRADVRGGSYMTVGWSGPGGTLRRFRLGERVQLSGVALAEICDLYDQLAAQIVRTPTIPQRKGLCHQGI